MSFASWTLATASSGCASASTNHAPPRCERLPDPLGPLGQLGARDANAQPDLAARIVKAVIVAPHDGHCESHGASSLSAELVGPLGADARRRLGRGDACRVDRQVHVRRARRSRRIHRSVSSSRYSMPDHPGGSRARMRWRSSAYGAVRRTSRWSSAPTASSSCARCSVDSTTSPSSRQVVAAGPGTPPTRCPSTQRARSRSGIRIRPGHLVRVDRRVRDLDVDEGVGERDQVGRSCRRRAPR